MFVCNICDKTCKISDFQIVKRHGETFGHKGRPGVLSPDEPRGPLPAHEPAARPPEAHRRAHGSPPLARRRALEPSVQEGALRLPGRPANRAPGFLLVVPLVRQLEAGEPAVHAGARAPPRGRARLRVRRAPGRREHRHLQQGALILPLLPLHCGPPLSEGVGETFSLSMSGKLSLSLNDYNADSNLLLSDLITDLQYRTIWFD